MKRVFAAIVTFNRPAILERCINSILAQNLPNLQQIYIVVNSPDQSTIDVINHFKNEFQVLIDYSVQDNIGPAGGFHIGLQKFLESECDMVWCMDDDVVAEAGSLKALIDSANEYEYVYPTVLTPDGNAIISFGWWGVLLSRTLVAKAGLPLIDLFYWMEDTEYLQNRLTREYKALPFRNEKAVVRHLHIRGHKRPSWFFYYVIRNTIYYRIYIQKHSFNKWPRRIWRTIYLYLTFLYQIVMREDRKMLKFFLVVRGTYDGLLHKIGKRVEPLKYK